LENSTNLQFDDLPPAGLGEPLMQTSDIVILKTGVGAIEPTDKYSDAQVVTAIEHGQKPVADTAVVCIDERPSAQESQPVREKVAGGNLNTFLYAAVATGWMGFGQKNNDYEPEEFLGIATKFLVDAGHKLGAHVQEPNHGSGTGCGAIDKAGLITIDIADNARHWQELAMADLGDLFDEQSWGQAINGYKDLAQNSRWQNWDSGQIQVAVKQTGGIVETLDGEQDAYSKEADPDNNRHNHWAEAININHRPGFSNDRDNASVPFFQVDVAPMVTMAEQASGSGQQDFKLMLHAMVMRQYGTAYRLTKNQRIIRTK
jgi:hypothetical protein